MTPHCGESGLQEFLDLLSGLRGVLEIRVWSGEESTWVGLRAGKQRSSHVLLQQVSRAATGFGLDSGEIQFGLLAD